LSAENAHSDTSGPSQEDLERAYAAKWKAFGAISISFFTMVMSMSMVFLGLSAIADDFGVTLRAAQWVVIAQALTISALMLPMGRMADIIGRKRVHLIGLTLFMGGAIFTALSPMFGSFGILILSRVIMAIGNSMGQSVGTAMVISVFPPAERGKAIGSQTTAVAVGGAVGPALAGPIIQWLGWEWLFWILVPPIAIAFVAGYFILDEKLVSQNRRGGGAKFDWLGSILSAASIIGVILLISNPLAISWTSPAMLGGGAVVTALVASFITWELRIESPMLQLRMFRNMVFSMGITTRFVGFLGTTAVRILMPIYLISLRGESEGLAGLMLFMASLGMATGAQASGRLADRFSERPFTIFGFVILIASAVVFSFTTVDTEFWIVITALIVNGLAIGFWNVPNNSTIMGSVPRSEFGVVGAFTNLTRNLGNVFGQTIAAAIVVGVMASRGFDIPLSEIGDTPGAGNAFMAGWKAAYILVTGFSALGLLLAIITKPRAAVDED
jgi:MFS family permease